MPAARGIPAPRDMSAPSARIPSMDIPVPMDRSVAGGTPLSKDMSAPRGIPAPRDMSGPSAVDCCRCHSSSACRQAWSSGVGRHPRPDVTRSPPPGVPPRGVLGHQFTGQRQLALDLRLGRLRRGLPRPAGSAGSRAVAASCADCGAGSGAAGSAATALPVNSATGPAAASAEGPAVEHAERGGRSTQAHRWRVRPPAASPGPWAAPRPGSSASGRPAAWPARTDPAACAPRRTRSW